MTGKATVGDTPMDPLHLKTLIDTQTANPTNPDRFYQQNSYAMLQVVKGGLRRFRQLAGIRLTPPKQRRVLKT